MPIRRFSLFSAPHTVRGRERQRPVLSGLGNGNRKLKFRSWRRQEIETQLGAQAHSVGLIILPGSCLVCILRPLLPDRVFCLSGLSQALALRIRPIFCYLFLPVDTVLRSPKGVAPEPPGGKLFRSSELRPALLSASQSLCFAVITLCHKHFLKKRVKSITRKKSR